jgi:phage tail-like protein
MTRLIRPYDFILDARVGWQLANAGDASIEAGSIQLQTKQNLVPSLTESNGSFGGFTLPRGVAIWHDEIFIADASLHCVWHWQPCCGPVAMLPTVGGRGSEPRQLNTPLGLTISHRDDLVIADLENRRLLVFTLPGLALRRIIGPLRQRKLLLDAFVLLYRLQPIPLVLWLLTILETAIWHPIDVASGSDGTLYVADDGNNLVWRLDAQGCPDPYYSGELPPEDAPRRLLVDRYHRVYVIPRVAESVLILDRYGKLMSAPNQLQQAAQSWLTLHFAAQAKNPNWQPTFEQEAEARAALCPPEMSQLIDVKINQELAKRLRQQQELARRSGQAIDTTKEDLWQEQRDDIYEYLLPDLYAKLLPKFLQQVLPPSRLRLLPQTRQQQIEAWLSDRNLEATIQNQQQAYAALLPQFQQDPEFASPTSPKSDRILLLAQTCPSQPQFTDLTIDAEGRLQLPDSSAGPYIIHRPPIATFSDSGVFQFQSLDSQQVGNPWHRVILELTAPERTSIRLFSFTSDIPRPDVTAEELLDGSPQFGIWQAAPANAEEWLIQSLPGRYLYLALVLRGPGDRTPSVERIYVYKERQSSLQYLPPLYQADETSRDLLDRWLSLFDTIFAEIESTIEDFPRYLDAQGAPADFLPWLASWFDLKLLPSWDGAKRRQFLQEIVKLYQRRGTIQGLHKLLQLHADLQEPMPQIVEHACGQSSNTDESPSRVVSQAIHQWLGDTKDALHHFSILMPAYTLNTPDKRLIIERLIEANKPAHTHFTLRPIYPGGVRLSSNRNPGTGIKLDSLLGSRRVWQLANAEASDRFLGEHSILPDLPMPKAVTGKLGYSRIGIAHLGGRHCPPCED